MERFQELVLLVAASLSGAFGFLMQEVSYVSQPTPSSASHAEVLFVGDMMFDRTIRTAMESFGSDFVFSCIDGELASSDMVIGNLEGPITGNPSKSIGSTVGSHDNFVFTFPEYVAPLMRRHNIRAVSLGNNHILNYGMDGVHSTVSALETAGVGYFGEPGGKSVSDITSGDIPLTFIGYNEFDSNWYASTTIAQIRDARARNRIPVVFSHWGDEYVAANDLQKKLAHEFIDAGAEIVIGSHPHVIQESEVYKGKHIYYSLGNFIFDQYWNDAVKTGLTVTVSFDTAGVSDIHEARIELKNDRRTCPLAAK